MQLHIRLVSMLCLLSLVLLCCQQRRVVDSTTRNKEINFGALKIDLRRGISTCDDVKRLFGEPDGTGQMLLPTERETRLVWVYQKIDVRVSPPRNEMRELNELRVRQDTLLIFFKGDYFDGYWWFSDAHQI